MYIENMTQLTKKNLFLIKKITGVIFMFISYGGPSLLVSMMSVCIILNVKDK